MAKGQTRTVRKVAPKHRAVKPRSVRPLDAPKPDNHEARSAARREAYVSPVVNADAGQPYSTVPAE